MVDLEFITNKIWVFDAHVDTNSGLIKQIVTFFGGRIFTLIVEEAILLVFITWLGMNSMIVKLAAQIIVIILNYIISKKIVFAQK